MRRLPRVAERGQAEPAVIRRAVTNVSNSIEQAVDGAKDDDNDGDSGEGAAP